MANRLEKFIVKNVIKRAKMTVKPKLSLKWRIRFKIYDYIGRVGDYCNNNVGDEYAYGWYRILTALFYNE